MEWRIPLELDADDVVSGLLWQVLARIGSVLVVDALARHVLAVWVLDRDDEWVAARQNLVAEAVARLNREWGRLVGLSSLQVRKPEDFTEH
jgi:hypothetical protein